MNPTITNAEMIHNFLETTPDLDHVFSGGPSRPRNIEIGHTVTWTAYGVQLLGRVIGLGPLIDPTHAEVKVVMKEGLEMRGWFALANLKRMGDYCWHYLEA